jgi:glycosyltransferase 2 family protein
MRLSISVAVAALLLFLLLRQVEWADAWALLKRLSPGTWLAVLGVHAAIYVLRTLRFAALIPDRRVPFAHLWSIQAANQMAALLLPMRTGEVTYPIYLRNAGVSLEVGVAGLVVSRALDLLAVLMLAVFSALYLKTPIERMPPGMALPMVLGVTLAAAALIAIAMGGASFIRFLAVVAARFGASLRILGRVEQVARGFETVGRYRSVAEAFTLTLLIWIGVDVFYYLLMADLGFGSLKPVGVAFGASAAILTNLLPVNTFAGLGTQEWGWTAGFELLGLDRTSAATSGLAVHAVQLVNVAVLGLVGQLRLNPPPREESKRVLRRLERGRARLLAAVARVSEEQAGRRPAPDRWSIAEIVEHLARVEDSIVAKIDRALATAGDVQAGRRVRVPLFLAALRLPLLRFRSPPAVRPPQEVRLREALEHLERSRRSLMERISADDDRVLRGKRFGHHLLGALDVLEWGDFVRYHEARHRRQIDEAARAVR